MTQHLQILDADENKLVTLARQVGAPDSLLRSANGLAEKKLALLDFVSRSDRASEGIYRSVFMSYSHADKAFANSIYASLSAQGIDVWQDNHQLKIGHHIQAGVKQAVLSRDRVLLLCSENSLQSEWVRYEIETALQREAMTGDSAILCLVLDEYFFSYAYTGPATRLRERVFGDFRNWREPECFDQGLDRVLQALWKEHPEGSSADTERSSAEKAPSPGRALGFLPILMKNQLTTNEAIKRAAAHLKVDQHSGRVVLQHLISSGYVEAAPGEVWRVTPAGRSAAQRRLQ